VAVFREEKQKADLSKSQGLVEADFPLVYDLDSNKTPKYSRKGFATYIVNKEGKIAAVLSGTKARRPMAKKILKELRKVTSPATSKLEAVAE